jgi:hypothetical protein
LDAKSITWIFQDTAGGCNVLSVTDPGELRQVCVHNQDDTGEGCIFIVDAVDGGSDCAMFGTFQEIWGKSTAISDNAYDFLNIALFLTDTESDPYEHRLSQGECVIDLWR